MGDHGEVGAKLRGQAAALFKSAVQGKSDFVGFYYGLLWLIFILNVIPLAGGFDTYKGEYGRQPATETNLGEVCRIIEAHHGQTE